MSVKEALRRLVKIRPAAGPRLPAPGLYHATAEHGEAHARFHLRVDPDGAGLLITNATAAARLNPSGVVMAHGLIHKEPDDAIVERVLRAFRGVSRETVSRDLEHVKQLMLGPDGHYPVHNLEDPAMSPYASRMAAPITADLCAAPPAQLLPILEKLWKAGIPHAVMVAAEGTPPEHLVRAVERAEDLGMIAGVRGRATDLAGQVEELVRAGLDHLDLLYLCATAEEHDALAGEGDHARARAALEQAHRLEICPVAQVALVSATLEGLEATVASLEDVPVTDFSFFAVATDGEEEGRLPASALPAAAALVEELATRRSVRFMWRAPVAGSEGQSLAELVSAGPRTSGDLAIRVEADGRVIPARGPGVSAGNLLTDPWERIWGHQAFRIYRERVEAPTRCPVCPNLAICAADCPAKPEGWAR